MSRLYSGMPREERVQSADSNVDMTSANPQTISPLFRLPAEIRIQIYEHLFGAGKVHILWRRLEQSGRTATSSDPWKEPEWKLTHTICKNPHDFSRAYALSKVPANFSGSHIREEDYINILTRDDVYIGMEEKRSNCETCSSERTYETYDPPEFGLKKLHANSTFHLAVLETCKQIHHEASSLPFALSVFDGRTASVLVDWAIRFLTPSQAAAIESIHLDGKCKEATEYLALLRHFPQLKTLRLSCEDPFAVTGADCNWKKYFDRSTIDCVEVIFGWDGSGEECSHIDQRPSNRVAADKLERFLMSSSLEEADAAAGWTTAEDHSSLYDYDTASVSSEEIVIEHNLSNHWSEEWGSDNDSELEEIKRRTAAAWNELATT